MAHRFTDEQVNEFRTVVNLFDRTGEGILAYHQISNFARCFGMNPLENDVALLLGGGDPENKPTLEDMQTKALAFEDILPILWALSQYKEPGSYSDFCETLKVFDREGDGKVSSAELRRAMTGLGEKMSTREVNMLMDGLEDHNGMVDYSKFIKRLMGEEADEDEQAAWEEKIAEQQERDRLAAFRNRLIMYLID